MEKQMFGFSNRDIFINVLFLIVELEYHPNTTLK